MAPRNSLKLKNNEILIQHETHKNTSTILVDIIIPVYIGLKETQECILSVLETLPDWAELIVINDASPEVELTNWLRKSALDNNFKLLENDQNLGFVTTVNRGMKLNLNRDVLLLNSDAEVANDWLDRIHDAAYSRERIGSITPFSNNATICSFPNFCEDNELLFNLNVKQIDGQFETYGKENNLVEIPTGVGFCMYMRRDCLNQVGYFNEEAFGRGYGEENDWCQRAKKAGWPNYHQLNVFVYHKGGVSFTEEQNPRKQAAMKILSKLHPNYTKDVRDYITLNPIKHMRFQMMLRFLASSTLNKTLLVSHDLGGGTEYHIQELSNYYKGKALFLLLKPGNDLNSISLFLSVGDDTKYQENIIINVEQDYNFLVELLNFVRISNIHFHHLIGIPKKILNLSSDLNCSYDITIHDYYTINGNPSLTDNDGVFFGENDFGVSSSNQNLVQGIFIKEWKADISQWFSAANRIIFPSADVKCRFTNYYPQVIEKSIISWHPDYEVDSPYTDVKVTYDKKRKLKILVLGGISLQKGARILNTVANLLKGENVEFHLLGYSDKTSNRNIVSHGPYSNKDVINKLTGISPDIMWFPAQWPETYSYTLSLALKLGIPVVAPNLGAFPERISSRKYSRVIPWDISAEQMSQLWREAATNFEDFFGQSNANPILDTSLENHKKYFYLNQYLSLEQRERKTGSIDINALLNSYLFSGRVIIVNEKTLTGYQRKKEQLLNILWKLRQSPLLAWMNRFIPYSIQRYIKNKLTKRSLYDIVR